MSNLHIPIFSMRSHETGLYDVTRDGNFQLHLARMQDEDFVVIPTASQGIETFVEAGVLKESQIYKLHYGENAVQTREKFWTSNNNCEYLITYDGKYSTYPEALGINAIVTDITGYSGDYKFYNNFNITRYTKYGMSRPYIDKFIGKDIDSVIRAERTTILNSAQLLVFGGALGDEEANRKLKIDKRVFNPSVVSKIVGKNLDDIEPIPLDGIFFPFRISDPCYKFNEVYETCKAYGQKLYVTDPNNSLPEDYDKSVIEKISITKAEYYGILKSRPSVYYHENPWFIFHPGLAELIYFKVNFMNKNNYPEVCDILVNKGDVFYG